MMNTKTLLTALTATAALAAGSAHAAPVLLGGFDGINAYNAPKQDASAAGNVTVLLSNSDGATGNNGIPIQGAGSILWGTTDFNPDAAITPDDTVSIIDTGTGTLTLAITNTGSNDLELDKLHWITKRDGANSPAAVVITYVSGDLSETDGTNSGQVSLGGLGQIGFDYALSSFLTNDLTLASAESATFSWSVVDPGTDQRLRVDNFAISGEVVPEPGSLALLGLGGLLVARRRRA